MFRSAARTGAGKGDVSSARAAAQEARSALQSEIGAQPGLVMYQTAEQDYRQAELHFSRAEYPLAKTLYERAEGGFAELLAVKATLIEALGLREQVRRAKAEAGRADAARFASEEHESGIQAQTAGEDALERGKLSEAIEELQRALYRFELATRASKPRQASLLQAQEARAVAEALRDKIREARLTWKPDYKEGERQFREGEALVDEGNFKSARRKFSRAAGLFQKVDF